MIPRELIDGFQHFAHTKYALGRAWLFGSRALGKKDGDWDIAIELRLPTKDARRLFFDQVEHWTTELQRETQLPVDLELFNPPETPNVEKALGNHARLFFLPWSGLVHEAGHLVVGYVLGNKENGIVFGFSQLKPDEMAGASGMPSDPQIGVKRSLAAVTACLLLCPETFPPKLVQALTFSVIPASTHPQREVLLEKTNLAVTGMCTDLAYARAYAEQICGSDPHKIDQFLQAQEKSIRSLIAERRKSIEAVAADIQSWLRDEEPEENAMMLYPGHRAMAIIESM